MWVCVCGAAWYDGSVWGIEGCVCVEKVSVRENVCVYNVSESVCMYEERLYVRVYE